MFVKYQFMNKGAQNKCPLRQLALNQLNILHSLYAITHNFHRFSDFLSQ